MAHPLLDRTGIRCWRLVPINVHSKNKQGCIFWSCICDCGNMTIVKSGFLRQGSGFETKSCGCMKNENASKRTHGKAGTKIYQKWNDMLTRCYNPKSNAYQDYGKRGIQVCDEWRYSFEEFYKDMGDLPDSTYTLERDDVNGNYEKSNCSWIPRSEQGKNKRNNRVYTYNRTTLIINDWAKILGVCTSSLDRRLLKGQSLEGVVKSYEKLGFIYLGESGEIIINKSKSHARSKYGADNYT